MDNRDQPDDARFEFEKDEPELFTNPLQFR